MLSNRSRPTRELCPMTAGDKVFGLSDDPRPHHVEWRMLWTAARDGICQTVTGTQGTCSHMGSEV